MVAVARRLEHMFILHRLESNYATYRYHLKDNHEIPGKIILIFLLDSRAEYRGRGINKFHLLRQFTTFEGIFNSFYAAMT